MNKKRIILFIALFLVATFSLVISAQPPLEQGAQYFSEGFEIEFTKLNIFKVNQTHLFNIHVFNISNGVQILNDTTSCDFHLFNSSGHHLIDQYELFFNVLGLDWEIEVLGTNFSYVGAYSYLVVCQDTTNNLGGLISIGFETTKTGNILTMGESIIYLILTIAVFIFFLLSLYFATITPYQNKKDGDGAVLKICRWKYVKIGLIMLSYVLFTWFLNVLIGISDNFIFLDFYYGFVSFLFLLLNSIALYLGIFCLVLMGYETIVDLNVQKEIKKWGKYKPNA